MSTIKFFNSPDPAVLAQKQKNVVAPVIQETKSAEAYETQMAKLLEEHAKQLAQLFEIASANLFKQQTQPLVSGETAGLFGSKTESILNVVDLKPRKP